MFGQNEETGAFLEQEAEAVAYFHAHGREEILRQFIELSSEANKRLDEITSRRGHWFLPGFTGFDLLTRDEKELRHKLQLGMMLCIDLQAEAQARIALRIAARNARRTSAQIQ